MYQIPDNTSAAPDSCAALDCAGSVVTLLVTGSVTEGRFALIEVVEKGGVEHPLHVHSREDEVIIVLDGFVTFHLDSYSVERKAGEVLFLPRSREHTYAVGPGGARLLVLVMPAGLEEYYQELAQPECGPCEYQDAERLVVVAARYGIDITGPPPISSLHKRSELT
jgi:quercetin dioxygenase-like cupin family protein